MWHREGRGGEDVFIGEATVPLVHLMDMEPHQTWVELTDPQGKAKLPEGTNVGGGVLLDMKFAQW